MDLTRFSILQLVAVKLHNAYELITACLARWISLMAKRVAQDVDFHVGDLIRERRIQLGISQANLSNALGVSQQQLQKYECGKNRISPGRVADIARALKVTPQFFFDGASTSKSASLSDVESLQDVADFVSSKEGLKLIKAFVKLPRDVQRNVVTLVESVADRQTVILS